MTTTEQALSKFVTEQILSDATHEELPVDFALIENGVLDSLGLQQLVSFLEREFDIELDDDDLVPENFETIGAIAKLIESVRS
jgi:acyl carrier protein